MIYSVRTVRTVRTGYELDCVEHRQDLSSLRRSSSSVKRTLRRRERHEARKIICLEIEQA